MNVRESLLTSRGEKSLHAKLATTFAREYGTFYPQVAFSELFALSREEVAALAAGVMDDPYGWYLMTSVDLTFCREPSVEPLFSIEFDGITAGVSRNGRFVRGEDADSDQRREAKLDVKARIAAKLGYPFVVLGWDELETVGRNEVLTIADGIAAELLAPQIAQERVAAAHRRGEIPIASSAQEASEVTMLEWQIEEEVRRTIDPFHGAVATIERDLMGEGDIEETISFEFLPHDPAMDASDIRVQVAANQKAAHVLCDVTVGVRGHVGRGHAEMRNIWAPREPMEPWAERLVESLEARDAHFVVTGRPIAQEVVGKVARYLAFLDLLDDATRAKSVS